MAKLMRSVFRPVLAKLRETNRNFSDEAFQSDFLHYHNGILSRMAQRKRYSIVFSTYGYMISCGVKPNFKTLNILVKCFSGVNDVDNAFGVMSMILKMGFILDVFTFTHLIKGLARVDRVKETTVLLMNMDILGCSPDLFCYHCVINALFKHGDGDRAVELYEELQDKGIIPNEVLRQTMIEGCLKTGKNFEARSKDV